MGIFLGKRKSNLLKKLVAPVVLSSSLFSSANAMYHSWKMEEEGVGFVFNDKSNILWINGIGEKRHLCDNNKKMVKLINDKISKLNNNNEGIEIRFAKKGIIGIKNFSFCEIKKLKKISFPDGFENIEGEVFRDCSELEEINFPKKMDTLHCVVSECKKLKRIVLPEFKKIDINFSGCKGLEVVKFPKTTGRFLFGSWQSTFANCCNLREIINFPTISAQTYAYVILGDTFRNCKKLNKIEIKSNVKLGLSETFVGCESAHDIYVENVANADGGSFYGCANLTALTLKLHSDVTTSRPCVCKEYLHTPNLISINIERMGN